MNNRSNVLLVLTVILIWASPAGVLADETDSTPPAASDSGSEITASDSSDSEQGESGKEKDKDKDKGESKGKGKGKAGPENGSDGIENNTPAVILVDAVSVTVQDIDDEPVERATVKISSDKTGSATKKITNDKGIATFRNLPATNLVVQVTAPGHQSHRQTIDLESDDDEIAIVLKRRD